MRNIDSIRSDAAWGDYDRDGDLDLLLIGYAFTSSSTFAGQTTLLRNDGSTFTPVDVGLPDFGAAGAAWGDYDNDGDLDLAVSGRRFPVVANVTKIYRNDDGEFVDSGIGFPEVGSAGASVAWADFDSDGDLDLSVDVHGRPTELYRNDGGAFAQEGVFGGDGPRSRVSNWGDFDLDGDLDLASSAPLGVARNDSMGFVYLGSMFTQGLGIGQIAYWGDLDNDGDLDLLLDALPGDRDPPIPGVVGYANLFINDDGVFGEPIVEPFGRTLATISLADVDGDLDLDVLMDSRLFLNDAQESNTAPLPPAGLAASRVGDIITFSWDSGSDGQTASTGLTYNLRVGTTPGGNEVVPSMAAPDGARLIPALGNAQQSRRWSIDVGAFAADTVFYWSVQSIDNSFVGSAFAPESRFGRARFDDVSTAVLADAGAGRGAAWGDYDGDGDPDLYLANGGANRLLRNDAGSFVDVTGGAPLDAPSDSRSAVWGDYDNDGDLDLYVVGFGSPNRLLRNDGAGFVDVSAQFGLDSSGAGTAAAWGDYDRDGFLDLYLVGGGTDANALFRGGAQGFVDVSAAPVDDTSNGIGMAWADADADGDLDLYVSNFFSTNKFFRNDDGTFVDVTVATGLDDIGGGGGVAWGDYDNDGDLDLYLCNWGSSNKLFRNDSGVFTDVAVGTALADEGISLGAAWGDFDNNGDLDLYVSNAGTSNKLFRNFDGVFVDDTQDTPLGDSESGQGVSWADVDGDGDLDLYLVNNGTANKLLRNETPNTNHWLHVDLQGTASNASGIGALVRVVAGGVTLIREISGGSGYWSQDALTAAFGLGGTTSVDSLIVRWPSGLVQVVEPVPEVNQRVTVTETPVSTAADLPTASDPPEIRLSRAVPNPFNPSTTIAFDLPRSGHVELAIYDVAGRWVRTLVRETRAAGRHEVVWRGDDQHGRDLASGVYVYRLRAGSYVETRRMTLIK